MDLLEKSRQIRISIIKMLEKAGSGHTGGSLGMADVFAALYFRVAKDIHTTKVGRDRFILSNGHICPVWYATLAEAGFIKKEELLTLRQTGSRLQGHPVNHDFPFAELSTGSLGQGFPAAVGLALGYKMDKHKGKIYVSLGDGELQEGSIWEAFMAASNYKLDNLIAFIDRNMVQQSGKTEEMMALEPLAEKIASFGWQVIEADGHDFDAILAGFEKAGEKGPSCIIFQTKMGKGVSFIEDKFEWHGVAVNSEQASLALKELGE